MCACERQTWKNRDKEKMIKTSPGKAWKFTTGE